MTGVADQAVVRAAALEWLRQVILDGELTITRAQLANDFVIGGQRFP